ncbi:sigma factor regulator N-terminal domain-containing protein [Marininema halotolerans]|uniref:Sigma factor regulator C-terminal n=1 Tax=Marininema halotolerans TaxID=1155944 RepID=A0A1I6UCW8_9BACL|nr:sigma factor regulator N-terminal domain-containing protein [Marininema halotolerans]SFS99316.1 Sigma factor regulator C-terminal [Marininema halotolerans]
MSDSLKYALKKAKIKQLLKTIVISMCVVLIAIVSLYFAGNHFSGKNSSKLKEELFLYNEIAEPNIQIDSQVTTNSSMFGGNIITNRSKNVNGYLVQWNTLTSSYNWLTANIDGNELVTGGLTTSDGKSYEYDKQTKNKAATFYHPSKKYSDKYSTQLRNELDDVSSMNDHVAEVAVSFDQPYTFQEVKEKIPDDLNIAWLYMASPTDDTVRNYGFDPSDSPEKKYNHFIKSLKKYDNDGHDKTIQKFLNKNQTKPFHEVKILGVMLTGKTSNFKPLKNQNFIRGSSVGATAKIVPYITPEK